jgi:hypothetical protein
VEKTSIPKGRILSWGTVLALLLLAGAAAVASASASPGPNLARRLATSAPSKRLYVAVLSTVPKSPSVPSTTVGTQAPSPVVAEPTTAPVSAKSAATALAGTTTTTEPMAVCQASQFVATTTTDQASYAPGQTVNISVTLKDTSSDPCADSMNLIWQGGCAPPPGWETTATATNSTGQVVWDVNARPTTGGLPENCPAGIYLSTVPGGFSATVDLSWAQDLCGDSPLGDVGPTVVPNPNCPGTPVPAGTYQITTSWERFLAPPVTITIASS